MDNGTKFQNSITQAVFEVFGVRMETGAVRHPQSQGAAEWLNRTLTMMMRKALSETSGWHADLHMLLHYYRRRHHGLIGMSPMLAMVGWESATLVASDLYSVSPKDWRDEFVARSVRIRDLVDREMSQHDVQANASTQCQYKTG